MTARRSAHAKAHPVCEWGASTWGECDKAVASAKADWDAMQQVILAISIVTREQRRGRSEGYKEDNLFDQLVRVFRGKQQDLMTKDGNPNEGPWAVRLRAAVARYHAGDLPVYNLYSALTGEN